VDADPYWNGDRLAEAAAFFGVGFNAAARHAAPLFGAMHRARLLAAVSMRMAQPVPADSWESVAPVEGHPRRVPIDKEFHDAAYRRGELSLTADRGNAASPGMARAAGAEHETACQSARSLNRQIGALADLAGDRTASLTRLISAVAQGMRDFTASMCDMPATARWMDIPRPDTVRHAHFDIAALHGGGYRIDVAACLGTPRPDMQARLAFALQIDRTGRRVIRLIVAPEMRLSSAELFVRGDDSSSGVTTA
jgi:hypothetical protein